jgi:two-component system sensor kinase FixL
MKVFWLIFEPDSKRGLPSYILAVILILLTLWARVHFGDDLAGPTLIVFTLPIILAAYWGGAGPGLLATATAILAANYYLLPPIASFASASLSEILQQLILGATGIFISAICETLHRARRRADASLVIAESGKAATARLAAIVESSGDAIIGKDLNGTITSWNAAAGDIFGYAAEEATGRNISMLIPHDRLAEEKHIISQVKAGQRIDHYETVRLRKDGSEVLVSLSVSPIRDSVGHIVGASKIARDVTEKARQTAQLLTLQSNLAHVARLSAMGQMSTSLAHELNQPLTAIANYVSSAHLMLKGNCTLQDKSGALDAIEKAKIQALRAGSIIKQMREFVQKRDAGRIPDDLNVVVEEAISLALAGSVSYGTKLNRELSPDRLMVLINRIQVQQVLVNLIRNSIEAMADSTERALTFLTGQDGKFAFVIVRDTGCGLAPEVRAKLFHPFITTKEGGMGVGLSISQAIMEAHGGKIEILDNDKPGTAFRVHVPLDLTPIPLDSASAL